MSFIKPVTIHKNNKPNSPVHIFKKCLGDFSPTYRKLYDGDRVFRNYCSIIPIDRRKHCSNQGMVLGIKEGKECFMFYECLNKKR